MTRSHLRTFGGERIAARDVLPSPSVFSARRAVLRARSEGGRVRPVGTRYTLSDVSLDAALVLDTASAREQPELLCPRDGRRLARVPAGTSIAALIAFLEPRGLALEAMPNFTGTSFVGACATCSHGASVHYAPPASRIRAFEIVDGLGRHRWIVGSAADLEVLPPGGPAGELEPSLFAALGTHLGAIAFVASVIYEPVPLFVIAEERRHRDWRVVRRMLASDALGEIDTLSAFVCPYATGSARRAVVTTQARYARFPGLYARGGDTPAQMLAMYLRMLRGMVEFRLAPESIPERLAEALDIFVPERVTESEGHKLMGTDYMGMPPRGIAIELAIPVVAASPSSRAALVETIDVLLDEIERLRARGRYVGGYLSIRFARRWDAPLSLSEGSDVCLVEILNVDGTPRQRDVLRDLEDAMRPYGLRRHAGLLHHHLPGEMGALYPQLDAWIAARDAADPDGVFLGAYARRHLRAWSASSSSSEAA